MLARTERPQASTRSIVEAAARAIAQHGVHRFTTAELSLATALNRATTCDCFPTWRDLLPKALRPVTRRHGMPPDEADRRVIPDIEWFARDAELEA